MPPAAPGPVRFIFTGGGGRNRTLDQLIKSQLLCQLSYTPGSFQGPFPCNGAPGRTRTCDLRVRSPALYPTELRAPMGCMLLAGMRYLVNRILSLLYTSSPQVIRVFSRGPHPPRIPSLPTVSIPLIHPLLPAGPGLTATR